MRFLFSCLVAIAGNLICVAASAQSNAPVGALDASLSARDWSIHASPSLRDEPPSPVEIAAFVRTQVGIAGAVCDAEFTRLGGEASFELVVSIDESGRHFCNSLVVFFGARSGRDFKVFHVWEMDSIRNSVVDLKGDGRLELVVPEDWSEYAGYRCIAPWRRIYLVTGDQLVEVDRDFPTYYRARLAELDTEIKSTHSSQTAEPPQADNALCKQMEADRISRFLGQDPRAGYDRAILWVRSSDPIIRTRAAAVFGDIDDQPSREQLRLLAADPDPMVRTSAQNLRQTRTR